VLSDKNLFFIFAGRYNISPKPSTLSLVVIPDQTITVGYLYEYAIQAQGDNVLFLDNTDLFNISPNGTISFYPTTEHIGVHLIEITATDAKTDAQTSQMFYLNITSVGEKPMLPILGYHELAVGELFKYTITALGSDKIYYTDDSQLFDIGLTSGEIIYTPAEGDEGIHEVIITAITDKGMSASEPLYLVIS
jgi:hypothetical protein